MANSDLNEDLSLVLAKYPKLELVDNTLLGEIDIFDNNDNYYSSYEIKITIPKGYPHIFPSVYETGGKIPRIADRHINDVGDCCVCVLQDADIRAKREITITNFINEYVIPFFANQIYYEANGEWANGEYKHGLAGILQYYCEIFETQDIKVILKGVDIFLKGNTKLYEKCFCGSDKKIKKCHRKTFLELGKMSKKRINDDYVYLSSFIHCKLKTVH
ncbi:MAG: hypothetical protein FWC41_01375 [Firmicutes bacterium]|nr:hypothetical protein [Bacillota bacterium]